MLNKAITNKKTKQSKTKTKEFTCNNAKKEKKVTEYGIVSNVHIKLINHCKSSRQ